MVKLKNGKIKKIALFIFCASVLSFFSCEEKIPQPNSNEISLQNPEPDLSYEVVDGVLTFKSAEGVLSLINELSDLSIDEVYDWSDKNNFKPYYLWKHEIRQSMINAESYEECEKIASNNLDIVKNFSDKGTEYYFIPKSLQIIFSRDKVYRVYDKYVSFSSETFDHISTKAKSPADAKQKLINNSAELERSFNFTDKLPQNNDTRKDGYTEKITRWAYKNEHFYDINGHRQCNHMWVYLNLIWIPGDGDCYGFYQNELQVDVNVQKYKCNFFGNCWWSDISTPIYLNSTEPNYTNYTWREIPETPRIKISEAYMTREDRLCTFIGGNGQPYYQYVEVDVPVNYGGYETDYTTYTNYGSTNSSTGNISWRFGVGRMYQYSHPIDAGINGGANVGHGEGSTFTNDLYVYCRVPGQYNGNHADNEQTITHIKLPLTY